jgi:Zn finger protein HypA/HybF involved in hydrogenase expression
MTTPERDDVVDKILRVFEQAGHADKVADIRITRERSKACCVVCGGPVELRADRLYWCAACGCGFKAPKAGRGRKR